MSVVRVLALMALALATGVAGSSAALAQAPLISFDPVKDSFNRVFAYIAQKRRGCSGYRRCGAWTPAQVNLELTGRGCMVTPKLEAHHLHFFLREVRRDEAPAYAGLSGFITPPPAHKAVLAGDRFDAQKYCNSSQQEVPLANYQAAASSPRPTTASRCRPRRCGAGGSCGRSCPVAARSCSSTP